MNIKKSISKKDSENGKVLPTNVMFVLARRAVFAARVEALSCDSVIIIIKIDQFSELWKRFKNRRRRSDLLSRTRQGDEIRKRRTIVFKMSVFWMVSRF